MVVETKTRNEKRNKTMLKCDVEKRNQERNGHLINKLASKRKTKRLIKFKHRNRKLKRNEREVKPW